MGHRNKRVRVSLLALKTWFLDLSRFKKVAVLFALLLLLTGCAGVWYIARLSDMDRMFSDVSWPNEDQEDNPGDISSEFNQKVINIALLGLDHNDVRSEHRLTGYTGLVDTIMVGAINIETGHVDVISIPRDSLVPIHNYGNYKDKINSANFWGWSNGLPGIEDRVQAGFISQVETISAILGVPIHYYVAVDMDAVEEIINIVGGVWYDVPEDVYARNGRLLVEAGYQKLDGRNFLYFVRNRLGSSDAQRAHNQQAILKTAFGQLKQANKLVYAPQILMSTRRNINTNLSTEQIMALALFGTKRINSDNISTYVLEGTYKTGGIPGRRQTNIYYLLDHPKRAELIKDIWGIDIDPGSPDQLLPPLPPEETGDEPDEGSQVPDPGDFPSDL